MMQGQRVDMETTGIANGTTPPGVVIPLGGFPVLSTTQEAFALDLFHALAARQPRRVFFANTNFIVQCQALRMRMRRAQRAHRQRWDRHGSGRAADPWPSLRR